jgi:hypothetical protein
MTPAVAVKALQGVRRGYILHPIFVWLAPHSQVYHRNTAVACLQQHLIFLPARLIERSESP